MYLLGRLSCLRHQSLQRSKQLAMPIDWKGREPVFRLLAAVYAALGEDTVSTLLLYLISFNVSYRPFQLWPLPNSAFFYPVIPWLF